MGTREVELRIPADLTDPATFAQSEQPWTQCDVVNCGRWYRRQGPAALQQSATVIDGKDGASFTVSVYELRWACPVCSGIELGQFLGHMDSYVVTPHLKPSEQAPCGWCAHLGLDACDKAEHGKVPFDNDEGQGCGVSQLPPNWIAGYRTRSTELRAYKVYLMFCRACGEVLQPDRPKRFIKHMNTRARDPGLRACMVPELDYLLQHEPGTLARAEDRPPLDPAQPVVASVELTEVFKYSPVKALSKAAYALHWELARRIVRGDEDARREIFADVPSQDLVHKLQEYAAHVLKSLGPEHEDNSSTRELRDKETSERGTKVNKRKRAGSGRGGSGCKVKEDPDAGGACGVVQQQSQGTVMGVVAGGSASHRGEMEQPQSQGSRQQQGESDHPAALTCDRSQVTAQAVGPTSDSPRPTSRVVEPDGAGAPAAAAAGGEPVPPASAPHETGNLLPPASSLSAAPSSSPAPGAPPAAGSCGVGPGPEVQPPAAAAAAAAGQPPPALPPAQPLQQQACAAAVGPEGGGCSRTGTGVGCARMAALVELFMQSQRESLLQSMEGLRLLHQQQVGLLLQRIEQPTALVQTVVSLEQGLAELRQAAVWEQDEVVRLQGELRRLEGTHARQLRKVQDDVELDLSKQLTAVREEFKQRLYDKEQELADLHAALDERVNAEVKRRLQ